MGIERFFSSINRNFNVVDVLTKNQKIECNTLLIDFNSIIHTVSSKIIKNINDNNQTKYKDFKNSDVEELILLEIKDYLINLFSMIKCNLVYIAFDGVPTFSKILEQKKRRFIGDFIDQVLSKFPQNNNFGKGLISPGTIFMDKLTIFLKQQNFNTNIIISDTYEKGEGEFKILDYISKNNLNDFIIYSPDADLIILCMIIWSNKVEMNLKILRYDQNTSILNIIYINHLIDYLFTYFEDRINKPINKYRYIKDLAFIMTIFGNDFLPKIEDININMDFYLVLDTYIINYVDNDYLLNEKLDIVSKSLFKYLSFLNKYESFLLERNKKIYKYQNFNYAQAVNLFLDIKNNKFNPATIFYIDYGINLNKNNKYGKLEYYFYDKYKLTKIKDYQYKNNFNQDYVDNIKDLRYQKFIPINYSSSTSKHVFAMKDMHPREKEFYLINNKLDKYHTLFNPNKIYKKEDNKHIKTNVRQYLMGLKWLINYYFKRSNIDETWFYSNQF